MNEDTEFQVQIENMENMENMDVAPPGAAAQNLVGMFIVNYLPARQSVIMRPQPWLASQAQPQIGFA
jgi:hypothetical protein